jgi:uncharacterized protein YbjT (DUF2867 family)
MKHERILVLGGSGFIGSRVVARLAAEGRRVTVPTRRRERAKHLILLPTVDVVQADIHEDTALERLAPGHDAVINLVGVLHDRRADPYGPSFKRSHVVLPRRIVDACLRNGVGRFLHMSALGADSKGPSMYLRSKGDGERAARTDGRLPPTIFRPSVVYGPGDHFLSLFAKLQKLFPAILLARAEARFQPVHVEDLAQAIVNAVDNLATAAHTYELGGPGIFTLAQLVDMAGQATGHRRPILPLPDAAGRLQAHMLEWMPGGPLMTRDNFDSMRVDNIVTDPLQTAFPRILNVTPRALDAQALDYLTGRSPRGLYNQYRSHAHRPS